MIATSSRPLGRNWSTISFASTLYLCPILDLLLVDVPVNYRAEIRLGLQEALVNAAKHGNRLDPNKMVLVRFMVAQNKYHWVITDEGSGFTPCRCLNPSILSESFCGCHPPHVEQECGRGLFILYQIFDQVEWNEGGTQLSLIKEISSRSRFPLIC